VRRAAYGRRCAWRWRAVRATGYVVLSLGDALAGTP
jgi:hypothetical protein